MKKIIIAQSDQEALDEGSRREKAGEETTAQDALDDLEDDVHNKDADTQSAWDALEEADGTRRALVSNNKWLVNGDLFKKQKTLLYLFFGCLSLLLLDSILFSEVSNLMLGMLGFGGFFLYLGKPLIPLGLMGIEVMVSNKLQEAKELPHKTPGKKEEILMWRRIAIALAVAIPLLGIATFLAFLELDSLSAVDIVMVGLVLGLAILSPIPHVLVLYTAYQWPEAKVLIDFRRQDKEIRELKEAYEKCVSVALLAYRHYERAARRFRMKYNRDPAPPLFSTFFVELVKERLGRDISPVSNVASVHDVTPSLNGESIT